MKDNSFSWTLPLPKADIRTTKKTEKTQKPIADTTELFFIGTQTKK
jgi:hypothetical protein